MKKTLMIMILGIGIGSLCTSSSNSENPSSDSYRINGRMVDVQEVTLNGQKYVIATQYSGIAICPSKNP